MKTHLSLFSGIGGLDLAAEMAGFTTVGQCEWAEYPTKVLEKHWPDVPRWRDIRTLTGKDFYERTGLRTVDVISGGVPCQPASVAGKRRGKDDDRWLWPEAIRVICEVRPTFAVLENVGGLITLDGGMAFESLLSGLEAEGYETQAFVFPACGVNAPHRRDRVAIIGYAMENANSVGCKQQGILQEQSRGAEFIRTSEGGAYGSAAEMRKNVANTDNATPARQREHCGKIHAITKSDRPCGGSGKRRRTIKSRLGRVAHELPNWLDEPDIPRVATGVPNRVDRLKCLGNAVVPAQFYPVFQAIADIMDMPQEGI